MGYREDTFRRRFEGAAKILGAKPLQVISIKLRENVPTSDYQEFFEQLEHEGGIDCLAMGRKLQEPCYLVSDRRGKIILVEHETGLEILYLAGSIASLINLIPLVIQGWRFFRSRSSRKHGGMFQMVEIRRFDEKRNLHEEHIPSFEMNHMIPMGFINTTITHLLETEMNRVFSKLDSLDNRVEKLEKILKAKPSKAKEKEKVATSKTVKSQK